MKTFGYISNESNEYGTFEIILKYVRNVFESRT
jgi:hypothetical protein